MANNSWRPYWANNASTTLTAELTTGVTTISVTDGSVFGTPSATRCIYLTLDNGADLEIVRCTGRATNDLTVVRAQDGTSQPASWANGSDIEARLVNEALDYLEPGDEDSSDGSIAIGLSADVSSNNSADSVAIGNGAFVDAISGSSVAIGLSATVDSNSLAAVAIGPSAYADGADSIGIGNGSTADFAGSVAVGGGTNAFAAESVVIGGYTESYAEGTFRPWGPHIIQRPSNWFYDQTEVSPMLGGMAIVSSPPCDLGPGLSYSVIFTTVTDGEVYEPSSPVGTEQFYISKGSGSNATKVSGLRYDATPSTTNTVSGLSTEPTWVIATQGDVSEPNATFPLRDQWIYVDPEVGLDIAVDKLSYNGGGGVLFFPTRVAFICQKYATLTATPFVSVGNQTSATAYVNNQQLTSITAADTAQWFDITDGDGATNIVFTLVTRGTGASGVCQGRFVIQGVYMQKMG
jgi:hypothetical protein